MSSRTRKTLIRPSAKRSERNLLQSLLIDSVRREGLRLYGSPILELFVIGSYGISLINHRRQFLWAPLPDLSFYSGQFSKSFYYSLQSLRDTVSKANK